MKRRVRLFLVMVILMSLMACAGVIKDSYVSLTISKSAYDKAMLSVADLQMKGMITDAKRAEINKAAKIYKESHNVAVDALEVYARTNLAVDKEKLVTALSLVTSKWAQMADLINAIKPGTVNRQFGKE